MSEVTDNEPSGRARFATVHEDDSGQRLDNFLLREVKGVPRTRLYRALRKGEVRVNKGRVKADYRLVAGDIVRIPPLRQGQGAPPSAAPSGLISELAGRVIHEDDKLLVLDKPSGLAVHGGSGLNYGLIESLRQARPEQRYLELVHRLDRDTSGLILIAKRSPALKELHRLLREKHIDKRYLALVAGQWPRRTGVVDAPLEKNVVLSGERMVKVSAEGKRAITEFSVLERFPEATLLEARPITGRTHQIRVHAQHAGCPLLGDSKYNNDQSLALSKKLRLKRLFLHASSLQFRLDGNAYKFTAELDSNLEKVLEKLRKSIKTREY
jgi:23S rRNA pseudouridine955/2504/2580 synthase